MKLEMMFGSPSDELYVLPGIQRFTAEHPDIAVGVHYASADNTPGKVQDKAQQIWRSESPKVLISGAGMSNVLTGVVKQYANIEDLVIGIPIYDEATKGLSSFLATSERPPRNPVLTTPPSRLTKTIL